MNRDFVARAIGLCLAGTSLLFVSATAQAAPAPDGSYSQSCRNVSASRGTLTAECKTRAGAWVSSTLDNYRDCKGDISNENGRLTCSQDDEDDRSTDGDRGRSDDATDDNDDTDRRMEAPRGSYRDTCRNGHVQGDDLIAECRTRDSEWHRTVLNDFRQCGGDIINDNGRLRCDRDDRGSRDGRNDDDQDRGRDNNNRDRDGWKPDGSYQDSCRRIREESGDLSAYCKTRSGSWRETELENFRECRGDIANDNGRLACLRGRYRITLYQHAQFGGRSRSFTDDQPWLSDFSDIASSAFVQGGRWQLCTRRNYRGRCVTIDSNVGNFTIMGINDRVESLRRVR